MRIFNYYRTSLIAGSVLALAISGLIRAQQPANLEPILRELGIMRNIFAGALEQQTRTSKFFGGGPAPDALYLAGQGMVFTFNLPGGDGFKGFMYCDENCSSSFSSSFSFNYDDDDDIDIDVDVPGPNPAPPAPPALPALPANPVSLRDLDAVEEELRDMNEELRDKSEELRELQRDLRNLGREQRNDPDDESLNSQIAALENSVDELEDELQQESESYRRTLDEVQNERAAAVNARREAQVDQVLGILCDYGSTLKALPANENVSLVFRNFTGNTNQVYVMTRNSVASCTSADSLQASAVGYQQ